MIKRDVKRRSARIPAAPVAYLASDAQSDSIGGAARVAGIDKHFDALHAVNSREPCCTHRGDSWADRPERRWQDLAVQHHIRVP